LMVMWTVLTWIIYPFLAIKYGFNGVALGSAIVAATSVIAIWIAKKHLVFKFFASIFKPTLASLMMMGLLLVLKFFLPINFLTIMVFVLTGGIFYFALIYFLVGKQFLIDIKKIFYALKSH